MWLISGPFDGQTGDVGFSKTKLLKTGRTYALGRKAKHPTQLVVSNPKVSAEHVSFIVGEHSMADVADPSIVPTLHIYNHKNKALCIIRGTGEERVPVNPLAQHELRDGDSMTLVAGVLLTFRWRPICCLLPPARGNQTVSFETCAALGIKVVPIQHPDITHHLTSTLSMTPTIATSMLFAAQLVRPDWLSEYARLGDLHKDNSAADGLAALESEFLPPSETKYRPSFAPPLPQQLKAFRVWEPNEARVGMLRGWQFVFVGEKGREVNGEIREMVGRGNGACELFDVASGPTRWQQILKKCKKKAEPGSGKCLAVVADEGNMKAAIGEGWNELVEVTKSFGLRFIAPAQVMEAVIYVETSRIDSSLGIDHDYDSLPESSSLPDFVPNTHPDEPSIPPESEPQSAGAGPSRRPLRKRATTPSLRPSPEAHDPSSVIDEAPEEPPRPRRPLTRRAKMDNVIVGVDDPSIIESQPPISVDTDASRTTPAPGVIDMSAPTPARSSRLKRRAGTAAVNPILAELSKALEEETSQPPLKKFKALFDESDPDHITPQNQSGSGVLDSQSGVLLESQTQTQTAQGRSVRHRGAAMPLVAVPEEMEESEASVPPAGGAKRKSSAVEGDVDNMNSQLVKRRAIENVNGVSQTTRSTSKPPSTRGSQAPPHPQPPPSTPTSKPSSTVRKHMQKQSTSSGAEPGKHDTDAAFLKALASTKKGKKSEDQFDREFNNLRISKPDLQKEEQVKQWTVLEDFGDDGDLRGNFMVIVEMEVPERGGRGLRRGEEERMDWVGKPDFKKFRRKDPSRLRPTVELVVDEENDYGMGSMYWKGNPQIQSQSQSQGEGLGYFQPSQTQETRLRATSGSKPPSKTQNQIQDTRRGKSRGLKVVDSDDSGKDETPPPSKGKQKAAPTTQTVLGQTQRNTRTRGKSQPLFLDSEGEDDADEVQDQIMEGVEEALGDENYDESTLRSSGEAKVSQRDANDAAAQSKKKKAPVLVVDDDSDTGMTFKGFDGRKKARARGR